MEVTIPVEDNILLLIKREISTSTPWDICVVVIQTSNCSILTQARECLWHQIFMNYQRLLPYNWLFFIFKYRGRERITTKILFDKECEIYICNRSDLESIAMIFPRSLYTEDPTLGAFLETLWRRESLAHVWMRRELLDLNSPHKGCI